jgi:hypothetical protein
VKKAPDFAFFCSCKHNRVTFETELRIYAHGKEGEGRGVEGGGGEGEGEGVGEMVQVGSSYSDSEQTVVPVDVAAALVRVLRVSLHRTASTHTSLMRPVPPLYSAQRESARAYAANGYSNTPPLCACSREGKMLCGIWKTISVPVLMKTAQFTVAAGSVRRECHCLLHTVPMRERENVPVCGWRTAQWCRVSCVARDSTDMHGA